MVPSRQRAHALRLAHAAAQLVTDRRVWATPDILPLEAWLVREVERHAAAGHALPRLLSPAEEWLLWRQCTAHATADMDLLNRGALAEALRRASALAAEFRIDLTKQTGAGGAEAQLLHEVQRAVDERCRSLGAATVQSLVSALPAIRTDPPVVFRGFPHLSPRLEAMGGERPPLAQELAHPRGVIARDEIDELERIAHWCKRQVADQPRARLLVILPGAPGQRERLATLIRQGVAPRGWLESTAAAPAPDARIDNLVAIEGGGPLARVPIIAHALATLAWLGGVGGDFESVSEWLRAPYWSTPGEAARAHIDLWLRKLGQANLEVGNWSQTLGTAPAPMAQAAQDLARQLQNAALALGGGTASPREWSERFRAAVRAVNWPGSRTRGSREQQTVVRFHELLDEFGQLALAVHSMSRDEAIHWFTELALRTTFRPADDDAVVTISPVLGDPVALYDGIWVAGLHADAFPQPVQPDPFLPLAAQLARSIPASSADGRLAEARALLSGWRAATGELVLSASGRAEDLELLPSPLLAQWLGPSAGAARSSGPEWLAAHIHRDHFLECAEDAGVPWPPDRSLPAGTRSLELQNLCAFRAYAELRLGSTELGAPEPGVAADVRGQLLHAALQKLWQQLRDSRTLAGHTDSTLGVLIERSVSDAADEILNCAAAPPVARAPHFARECRRAARLIRILCALERERQPFRIQGNEVESTLTVAGARMTVRIDRIDALEGGGRAILDYKTGKRTPADWYAERPSHPQLLTYLQAVGRDVVALATVNVTAREVRFDGIARTSQTLPKVKAVKALAGMDPGDAWESHTREWLARIERLACEFLAGRAEVAPKPHACDYCHVMSVCRISERARDAAADADDRGIEAMDESMEAIDE
ncbi:MAG: PD-(D/E)XK nuclease family protein [Steroidobacteraceae bacterium]